MSTINPPTRVILVVCKDYIKANLDFLRRISSPPKDQDED